MSILDDNLVLISDEDLVKNAIQKYMAEFGPSGLGRNNSEFEYKIIFPYGTGMINDYIKHPKKYFLYFQYEHVNKLCIIVATKQYYSKNFIPCTYRQTYMKGYKKDYRKLPLSLYYIISKING